MSQLWLAELGHSQLDGARHYSVSGFPGRSGLTKARTGILATLAGAGQLLATRFRSRRHGGLFSLVVTTDSGERHSSLPERRANAFDFLSANAGAPGTGLLTPS